MRTLLGATALASTLAVHPLSAAWAQETIPQGGEIIVTYKDDFSTLDPAIGYDWQNWSIIKSLFDGLMDYVPGTTELVPDLAESYAIEDGGRTYRFTLRNGVAFHNGRKLTSADIKYSIERTVSPLTQSPGARFFASIVGQAEMVAGNATTMAGIETPDERTVIFRLTRPDATFLHAMAINFSFVVPKEAIDASGADFGKQPVGTGAFKLKEWARGQRLVLERNPNYWKQGKPHLNAITFEVGQEPLVALLRWEQGEVDLLGDPVPAAQFPEIKNNADYADNLVEGSQLHTGYVAMNVTMKPFDDVRARRAVNHAINRDRIVQIINGRAGPATQPLPPSMPAYNRDYAGYAYDPDKAKALLEEAGLADGVETVLFANNTDPNPRIAQAIQQDLAAVGIKAKLRILAQADVIAAGGEKAGAPLIWSGGMAWIADFPDPSNFYGPVLSCGGAIPGGWNWSWYCNEELDSKAAKADSMSDPGQSDARLKLWSDVYLGVMADAPWAPVFNERRFTLKSDRLGGPNAIYDEPVHIPVNYDEVFIKEGE